MICPDENCIIESTEATKMHRLNVETGEKTFICPLCFSDLV